MKPGRFLMEPFLDYCCGGWDLYLNDGDALGMAQTPFNTGLDEGRS
jgi:hypothetical protein